MSHIKPVDFGAKICYTNYNYNGGAFPVENGVSVPVLRKKGKVNRNMITREVSITNKVGLHARPATFFIQKANSYRSVIWVEKDERRVNAKSLLGILSLGISQGMNITLIADGQDENEAVEGLAELINSGLAE